MSLAPALATGPASANVAEHLLDVTTAHPDRPALIGIDGRVHVSFAELTDRTASVAAGLVRRGLRPGGRVALLVRDREQALVLAIATLWAGGTLVVPPSAHGWRLAVKAAARSRPTAVVAGPGAWILAPAVPDLARARIRVVAGCRRGPGLVTIDDIADDGRTTADAPVPRPPDAPALVSWTTGTTGRPHPVVRTHAVLNAQHEALRRLRSPRPGDVDLPGLPTLALHDLACGVAVVIPTRADLDGPGAALRARIASAGVTMVAGFPTLFERLIGEAAPGALSCFRSVHVGGAPVGPLLLDQIATVAPNARIVVVYGATEAEPIAAIDATDWRGFVPGWEPGRGSLVGAVCEGVELRLAPLHTSTSDVRPSPPTSGRILVRGARVARDPVRSDAAEWLDTGDVGAIDADGRLWLLGRSSNAGPDGFLPAEIEEPVSALAGVEAVALIAVPGRHGPRSVLVVEAEATAKASVVQARVASLASRRGWDLDRVVLRRLPRDLGSGKIDYQRLRASIR